MAKGPRRKKAEKHTESEPAPKKTAKPKKEKVRFNSPIDEGDKARFLHHLPTVMAGRERVASAVASLRALYKTARSDGFNKVDFDYAEQVTTPDKEKSTKEGIRRRLLIARFMGSDLGHQLDLFSEPERVPAVDRAYEEGQTASMQNKPASPPYDPSTEQYRKWLDGWNSHQTKLAQGFKKTDPKKPNGAGGLSMDEEEFAAEQAAAAQALAEHGLDDEAPF